MKSKFYKRIFTYEIITVKKQAAIFVSISLCAFPSPKLRQNYFKNDKATLKKANTETFGLYVFKIYYFPGKGVQGKYWAYISINTVHKIKLLLK